MTAVRFVASALVTLALVTPSLAEAQACLGNPSFSTNHLQMSADVVSDNSTTTFGAAFTSGSESVFAGLGLGGAAYDGANGSTLLASGNVGFQVPLSAGTAQICPVLAVGLGFGPSDIDGLGTKFSSRAVTFGLSAGGELVSTPRVKVVPAVSLGFVYNAGVFEDALGKTTQTDTYLTLGATAGIVLSDRLSIRPNITFPVGLDGVGVDPTFGLGFALNYGGRR